MDSDGLEFYYQIPDAAEKVQRMENDFYDFVKSIDRSQLYWDYVWKYAQSLIYTLKTLHNDNTEWVAEKLDIPVDIVRSIRTVLDEHVLLE
jgi:hypothetical protein